jgi:hypothetical protein
MTPGPRGLGVVVSCAASPSSYAANLRGETKVGGFQINSLSAARLRLTVPPKTASVLEWRAFRWGIQETEDRLGARRNPFTIETSKGTMNEHIAPRILFTVCLLGSLSLVGCSASGSAGAAAGGMATTLESGQRLAIIVRGEHPAVRLTSEGPGGVALVRESQPPAEARLGSRGVTELSAPGGGTFAVINRSNEKAAVDVRVFGADGVEIKGPIVAPAAK